jgi:hypothetical protein
MKVSLTYNRFYEVHNDFTVYSVAQSICQVVYLFWSVRLDGMKVANSIGRTNYWLDILNS